jgi:flavin-dependent dehydrogenase
VLDSALLEAAERAGATISRGTPAVTAYPACRVVRTRGDELIQCEALFVATGKHDLRGAYRPNVRALAPSVGLRAELPPSLAREQLLSGCVELHLFDGGYAGLLLQEDGSCNLCLSVSADRMAAAASAKALFSAITREAPVLAERVGQYVPREWQAIGAVPYGWSIGDTPSGVFRLGDQAGVIASIAGDGLALALVSGTSAAAALLAGGPAAAPAWQHQFQRSIRGPLGLSKLLRNAAGRALPRRLMMALAVHLPRVGALAARATRIGGASTVPAKKS